MKKWMLQTGAWILLSIFTFPMAVNGIHHFAHQHEVHCSHEAESLNINDDCPICDSTLSSHFDKPAFSEQKNKSAVKIVKAFPLTDPQTTRFFNAFRLRGPPISA